jgi:hypothetical protein
MRTPVHEFTRLLEGVCFGWGLVALLLPGVASAQVTPAVAIADVPGVDHGTHPLDPALKIAREGLEHIEADVRDYTATVIKRERIKDKLTDHIYMQVKIRHRQVRDGVVVAPFSAYIRFLQPRSLEGREAIWVEGRNGGKIVAHDRGIKNILRLHLDPTGTLAMWGNRYPITDIGFRNLVEKLIEKAEEDRKHGDCDVEFVGTAKVDGRLCTMIQVTHPVRQPHFDFYRARIFVDQELNIPIRYAAWSWPEYAGGPPLLLEEYTYRDVRLNVGLTDADFDPDNPRYNYP